MLLKKLCWLLPVIALTACGNDAGKEYNKPGADAAPAAMAQADSTDITPENKPLNDPSRKIIHTADFHCKVQNVFAATTRLEQLVKSVGGIVQESSMDNISNDIKTTYYKPDSLHQAQTYTTTAVLTLRVPSRYMDSVTNAIPGMTGFIDSRKLKQSDVTWTYLANELKSNAGDTKATASRAMQLARKSKDPIDVQEYEDGKQEQKIDRKIGNLQLMDDVSYATITVSFSQPEQVYIQTIVNPDYYMRTPFSLQAKAALSNGWYFVTATAVAIMNIWPLLILIAAAWIAYRKMKIWRRQPAFAKK